MKYQCLQNDRHAEENSEWASEQRVPPIEWFVLKWTWVKCNDCINEQKKRLCALGCYMFVHNVRISMYCVPHSLSLSLCVCMFSVISYGKWYDRYDSYTTNIKTFSEEALKYRERVLHASCIYASLPRKINKKLINKWKKTWSEREFMSNTQCSVQERSIWTQKKLLFINPFNCIAFD